MPFVITLLNILLLAGGLFALVACVIALQSISKDVSAIRNRLER